MTIPLADVIVPVATSDPSRFPDVEITYLDISSIHNDTNRVTEPKVVLGADAPSRARQIVAAGDVLFSTVRPNLRAVAQVPEVTNGIASTGFCVLRAARPVASKYLFYFVLSEGFLDGLLPLQRGVSYPAVRSGDVLSRLIPLAPAAEQTRIVEKLEELLSDLDTGVAELKAAQKKLAQYRQALLKAAVEGSLTAIWRETQPAPSPQPLPREGGGARAMPSRSRKSSANSAPLSPGGRGAGGEGDGGHAATLQTHKSSESGAELLARILTERRKRWETKQLAKFAELGKALPKDWQSKYPEPVAPDTTDLPALPEGWVWSSIGQCFHVAVGATPSRKEPSYWNGAMPWVSSGEVRFSRIIDTREKITDAGLRNSSTQINPIGSVLLGMIGEGKTRGQVSILDIEATNNQNCAAIWASETDVPPEYVYYWLWSRYDETRRGSSGNNQPALNKSIVERIPFPLPPLRELAEIVNSIDASFAEIARQEIAVAHALKQSTAQRKNILKTAFSGQLVPQDPNDEPASMLLARIRAERAGQTAGRSVGSRAKPKREIVV